MTEKRAKVDIDRMSGPEVATAWGVTRQTVCQWAADGLPRDTSGRYPVYRLADVVMWREARLAVASGKGSVLMDGDDDWSVEYRKTKTEQERLRLGQMRGELISKGELHDGLQGLAGLLRQAGEALQRVYGPEALDILNDALDRFETYLSDGDSASDDRRAGCGITKAAG